MNDFVSIERLASAIVSRSNNLDRTRPHKLLTDVSDKSKFHAELEYLYLDNLGRVKIPNKTQNQTYAMQIEDARFWADYYEKEAIRLKEPKFSNLAERAERIEKLTLRAAAHRERMHELTAKKSLLQCP